MQYLFLLYRDDAHAMTPEQGAQAATKQWAILDETGEKGILKAARPLARNAPAKTFRAQEASVAVTDGPFTETKEALGGFYVLDCADWEEAQYWGSRLAQTGCATTVEVRPLMEIPARPNVKEEAVAMHG